MLTLFVGFAFVAWLFRRDMRWRRLPSNALWIPGLWLAMASSRQMSYWLDAIGVVGLAGGESSNLEGSPVNVIVNGSLLLGTLAVLRNRGFNWSRFAASNKALVGLYLFFFCSMLWSPFPLPTVKRVIQEFGCVLTGLIILSEKDPAASLRIVFVRVSYVLFPLSVVFIRYFPGIGRVVSPASGTHMLCGIADHKNSLGQLAMVFCLAILWDLDETGKVGTAQKPKPERWVRLLNMGIGIYLLIISSCGTALLCLVFGVALYFASKRLARLKNPRRVFLTTVISIVGIMALNQMYGISSRISEAMGRGSGLSGRTQIWQKVLEKDTSHFIGAGFRGFWETSEGESVWRELGVNPLITAHNGYLETYLNGGIVGLILLGLFIWSTGLNAVDKLVSGEPMGRLAVLIWPILLISNATESLFLQTGPIWLTLLLVTIDGPRRKHAAPDGFQRSAGLSGGATRLPISSHA